MAQRSHALLVFTLTTGTSASCSFLPLFPDLSRADGSVTMDATDVVSPVDAPSDIGTDAPQCPEPGTADCDSSQPGCETHVNSDPANCGGCGIVCRTGRACTNGECERPTISQLAVGEKHVCALLANSHVECWGGNDLGQLGNGMFSAQPVLVPTEVLVSLVVSSTLTTATRISTRANDTCVLLNAGQILCWGSNAHGLLGRAEMPDGGMYLPANTARVIAPGSSFGSASNVVVGTDTACAITAGSGNVYCWGAGANGQIMTCQQSACYPVAATSIPTQIVGSANGTPYLSGISLLAVGSTHACGQAGNTLLSWGDRRNNALDDGFVNPSVPSQPFPLPHTVPGVQRLAAGYQANCLLDGNGGVLCWGLNDVGQMGNSVHGMANQMPLAVQPVEGPTVRFADVAFGKYAVCALGTNGFVYCWGQFGADPDASCAQTRPCATQPTRVQGVGNVLHIAVGISTACASTTDNKIYCWGLNTNGQFGIDPTVMGSSTTAVLVPAAP